jgi:hypothetical protein
MWGAYSSIHFVGHATHAFGSAAMARLRDFVVLLMSDVHSLFGGRTLSRGEEEGKIKQKETKFLFEWCVGTSLCANS